MSDDKKSNGGVPKPPSDVGAPERNIFGGKNPLGLYVPMTDDEMDALNRMIESKDLILVIHGWGRLENPRIQFGDLRVCIKFRLDFRGPEKPTHVYFFDLELKVRDSNITLFRKRMPVSSNGTPLLIQAGMFLEMAWDIAIDHIDPNLVKMYLPGLHGLTSTRLDRETGQRTLTGNMKLTESQLNHIRFLESQKAKIQKMDTEAAVVATKKAGFEVKDGDKGPQAPDVN